MSRSILSKWSRFAPSRLMLSKDFSASSQMFKAASLDIDGDSHLGRYTDSVISLRRSSEPMVVTQGREDTVYRVSGFENDFFYKPKLAAEDKLVVGDLDSSKVQTMGFYNNIETTYRINQLPQKVSDDVMDERLAFEAAAASQHTRVVSLGSGEVSFNEG